MKKQRLLEIKRMYRETLFNSIIPFWLKYSLDRINGGYYHYLNRDGSLLSSDKPVWIQGRGTWLFSRLYNNVKKDEKWFGYLYRDGSVCLPIKGSVWKGPFHIPRFLLYGIELIEKLLQKEDDISCMKRMI